MVITSAIAMLLATAAEHPVSSDLAPVHAIVHRQLESATEVKVWVFLADKCGEELDAQSFDGVANDVLHKRALERRKARRTAPGLIDERDMPVCCEYVDALEVTGAQRCVESRWLNAVSMRANESQINALAALPFVLAIEPVRLGERQNVVPTRRSTSTGGVAGGDPFYGGSLNQLEMINIPALHDMGFTGEGVVVGMIDTGFERSHEAFNEPGHEIEVLAEWDFIDDDGMTGFEEGDPFFDSPQGLFFQHSHGTQVLGAIAGYKPGSLIGGAHGASFILAKVENIEGEDPVEEDRYVAGLEFVERMGADISSTSLGYISFYSWFDLDGLTAVSTIATNTAIENGLICVTAAGNGGIDMDLPSLIPPGDAFKAITCGATNTAGDHVDFSATGPTPDGRTKPEVMAQGEFVLTVHHHTEVTLYTEEDGTSMSTPLVASAVALLLQMHSEWTIDEMRTALFETADYFVEHGEPDPISWVGYGVIDALAASQMSFSSAEDLDGDGVVSAADLALLLGSWGPCGDPRDCPADLDGDGTVGAADLALLLGAWG